MLPCWLCALVLPSTSQPHTCGASLLVQAGLFLVREEEKEGKERGRSRGLLSSLQESHGQNCHPHDTAKALARMALIHNSSVCPNLLFVAPAYMPLIGLHKAPNSLQASFFFTLNLLSTYQSSHCLVQLPIIGLGVVLVSNFLAMN